MIVGIRHLARSWKKVSDPFCREPALRVLRTKRGGHLFPGRSFCLASWLAITSLLVLVGLAACMGSAAAQSPTRAPITRAPTSRAPISDTFLLLGERSADLPVTGQSSLFQATVVITPLSQAGHFSCRVRLVASAGFPADRRFVVRLTPIPGGYLPVTNGIASEIPVTVAEGDSQVTLERWIPAESIGDAYRIELLEDGRVLDGFRTEIGSLLPMSFRVADYLLEQEMAIRVLAIYDERGDASERYFATTAFQSGWLQAPEVSLGALISEEVGADSASPLMSAIGPVIPAPLDSLTVADWRGYQAFDVLMITPDAAATLANRVPGVLSAIREWVLLGGVMVLVGAEDQKSIFNTLAIGGTSGLNLTGSNRSTWGGSAGAGRIIGLPANDPEGRVSLVEWVTARELVEGDERRSLTVRRGVEPILGDQRFGRWLIAGVAEPPVYTFIGLLTVFVVLVGPLAYRQTVRADRGYLMFVIAPLLAIATTATMITYGIVSDGFGTVARVRQLTWIDGGSGDAAERVRGTYFAGLRPSAGLTFPGSAEVLTLREPEARSWRGRRGERPEILGTVTIMESSQRFSPSFLASRQQRQFVFHQPRRDLGVVQFSDDQGSGGRISSTLAFPLRDLIARDADGIYWTAPSIPEGGAETSCQELDEAQAANALGTLYGRYRLVQAISGSRSREAAAASGWLLSLQTRLGTPPEAADGVFEHWLARHLQLDGTLPESSFVAVSDVSRDVVAIDAAELVDSVRFVFGTMP